MCQLINFAAQLAEKFPWNNLETEVDGTIFSEAFGEENELFWVRLNEVLELHKEEAPLRCIEILDFVGRHAVRRFGDITLCHFRYTDFSVLVLQYIAEAVKQEQPLSVLQLLMLMDIIFEARTEPELNKNARKVLASVNPKLIYVSNPEIEKRYLYGYQYLWKDIKQFRVFAARFNLL